MYALGKNSFFLEIIMMMRYVAVTLTALALLGGCQKKEDPSEAGPAERAGRKLDQVTQDAGQKLDSATRQANEQLSDAAKETSQKLDKAADKASEKLNEATKEAGRKLERAGEKMQTSAEEREAKK
jgi:biopolymer transport protein ExbB/TolQ